MEGRGNSTPIRTDHGAQYIGSSLITPEPDGIVRVLGKPIHLLKKKKDYIFAKPTLLLYPYPPLHPEESSGRLHNISGIYSPTDGF